MCNVPLEAWTMKGISALASRIGKPLIMDVVTAGMCQVGVARAGYARVLVEVDAQKDLPKKIDVAYKNKKGEVISTKLIQVLYSYIPSRCKECGVFDHCHDECPKIVQDASNKETINDIKNNVDDNHEGFNAVGYKKVVKQKNKNEQGNKEQQQANRTWRVQHKGGYHKKVQSVYQAKQPTDVKSDWIGKSKSSNGIAEFKKPENFQKKEIKIPTNSTEIRNQFDALQENEDLLQGNEESERNEQDEMQKRNLVDMFVQQKQKPSSIESEGWTQDMYYYFQEKWELMYGSEQGNGQNGKENGDATELEDVCVDKSGIALSMEGNEVIGADTNVLQDC